MFTAKTLNITHIAFTTVRLVSAFLAAVLLATASSANTSAVSIQPEQTVNTVSGIPSQKSLTGWSFSFDNDFLVPGKRDQDYTYGLNLRLMGKKTESHWSSVHTPLNALDSLFNLNSPKYQHTLSSIEFGLFGFTPETLSDAEVIDGDRPYASLLYATSNKERLNITTGRVINSSLTVGVIGAGLVEQLQKKLHNIIDSEEPLGWGNQISDGGEITAKYSLSQQQLLSNPLSNIEIKQTTQGTIGYITELNYSVSLRAGQLASPWQSFNPELTSYGEGASPSKNIRYVAEHYFWAGLSIKARAYNAFLQGQFRRSALTYDRNELNTGILEGWIGYTVALKNGFSFNYSLRGHTSELKNGVGNRSVIWGGLRMTKHI